MAAGMAAALMHLFVSKEGPNGPAGNQSIYTPQVSGVT
jgi:hypothetical protein